MSFSLPFLLDLSLRGSLVLLAASIADLVWAGKITARWRRVWWLIVPFAFLWPGSMMPTLFTHHATPIQTAFDDHVLAPIGLFTAPHWTPESDPVPPLSFSATTVIWTGLVWLAGGVASALMVIVPTWKVQRQWSTKRLSTDPALLNLLEDA